jgi:hypothetical protein
MKKNLFFAFICCIVLELSCNNIPESKTITSADSSHSTKTGTSRNVTVEALLSGNVPHLLMSKSDLDMLFGKGADNKKRRIVFQFLFPTTEPSPLLIAYGAKKVDEFHLPAITLTPSGLSTPISNQQLILGNLDLPKRKYESLKASLGGILFTHMLFVPQKPTDENPYLRYKIDLVFATIKADKKTYEIKNLTSTFGDEFLNPCPPKRPCGNGVDCDNDPQN